MLGFIYFTDVSGGLLAIGRISCHTRIIHYAIKAFPLNALIFVPNSLRLKHNNQ